jgi:signal peptidase I
MERFEKVKLTLKNDSVFVNDQYQKYYIFTQDYFFIMGDNRNSAVDSRTQGFIPESHIIGKVSMLLYSKRKGKSFTLLNKD